MPRRSAARPVLAVTAGLLLAACSAGPRPAPADHGEAAVQPEPPLLSAPAASPPAWEAHHFADAHTEYRISDDGDHIHARCHDGGASALYQQPLDVDLQATPLLAWRWRIAEAYDNPAERSAKGDDFVARVYVVGQSGFSPLSALAVNYVWASEAEAGSHWPNPHNERSHIFVLQSGTPQRPGRWREQARDVAADFRTAFGQVPGYLRAVAVMSDCDNTGAGGEAWFADIRFRKGEAR